MKQKDYMLIGGLTLSIFLMTYVVLALLGFVPEQFKFVNTSAPKDQKQNVQVIDTPTTTVTQANQNIDKNLIPTKVEIPKINVSTVVNVPAGIDVATLDNALTKGAVYYPGSGTLQGGNMFLFGHSTNWSVVNNAAYKTFNNLDKLVVGDEIVLTSGGEKYVYVVRTVKLSSEDDAVVQFASNSPMLTISTCDTFGRKQDRWVVEADLKTTF